MEIKQNDFKTAYYNLLSKYAELEAQIEKMKCCENCKYQIDLEYGEKDCEKHNPCSIKFEYWELEE